MSAFGTVLKSLKLLEPIRAPTPHQILMLALRWGERALPLAWRVEETEGAIGFGVQKGLLDTIAAWLPEGARVRLLGDRFYGTPALIGHCQSLGWDYRLGLKGNLRLWIDGADAGSVEQLARGTPYLTGVELTARRVAHKRRPHPGPRPRSTVDHRYVRGSRLPHPPRLRTALGHRADVL